MLPTESEPTSKALPGFFKQPSYASNGIDHRPAYHEQASTEERSAGEKPNDKSDEYNFSDDEDSDDQDNRV